MPPDLEPVIERNSAPSLEALGTSNKDVPALTGVPDSVRISEPVSGMRNLRRPEMQGSIANTTDSVPSWPDSGRTSDSAAAASKSAYYFVGSVTSSKDDSVRDLSSCDFDSEASAERSVNTVGWAELGSEGTDSVTAA